MLFKAFKQTIRELDWLSTGILTSLILVFLFYLITSIIKFLISIDSLFLIIFVLCISYLVIKFIYDWYKNYKSVPHPDIKN